MELLKFCPVFRCVAVFGVILAMVGCKSSVNPQNTTPVPSNAKTPSAGQGGARVGDGSLPTEWVPVKANCIVYHSGYDGTIVAPGVSEPSGTVGSLKCGGKIVEITSKEMVKGVILTKEYGKVRVHFASMVSTIGAGDFTSDPGGGRTLPERVIDMSVQKSAAESFSAQFH
jgi:hypothetical protein